MSLNSIYANSLWWVQFQLQGGWRRNLALIAIYALVVGGLTAAIFRMDPGIPLQSVCQGWLLVLAFLQVGVLMLVGSSAIRRAVQRDFSTGMIESHRLTPMSGLTAAIGYLIGSNIQVLVLAGCNVTAGLIFTVVSGDSPDGWLMTNGAMLWVALIVWSIITLLAVGSQGSMNLLLIAVLVGAPSAGFLVALLPGLGLLVGLPFWSMTNNAGPRLGLNENAMSLAAPALLLQAGILATCLAATARKYRRADIRAFPPGLGLILVLLVALLGGIGLGATDGFGLTDYYKIKPAWQLAAWLLVGALFGLLPLSVVAEQGAIARTLSERRRHGRRLIGLTLAIALLVVGTAWVLGRPWYPAGLRTHESNWTWSLAIVFLTLAPMGPWMWVAYMARLRVAWLALAWVLLFWIVPPVVDMAAAAFSPMQFQPEPSWITAISPPGALVLVWQHPRPTPGIGVMIQAAIAAGAWIIFIVLTRMTLAKEPSASVST